MDEQKVEDKTDDMTIGSDGQLNSDKTNSVEQEAPVINDVAPPPEPNIDSDEQFVEVKVAPNDNNEATTDTKTEESVNETEPHANESPASVAVAPDESTDESVNDNAVTTTPAPNQTQDEVKISDAPNPNDAVEIDSTPAAMGVAASQMGKHPHRNNKKFAAIVTVVVAIILAGTAVYVYMSANNNAESGTENTSTAPQTNQVDQQTPATVGDVDQTADDVDSSINTLDEATDFDDTDLTDTTLGL